MIILLFLLALVGLVYVIRSDDEVIVAGIITMSLLLTTVGGTISSAYNQSSDLGAIRAQHFAIQVQLERVARLTDTLSAVHPAGTALINGDTPAKSLIDALAAAQKDLADAQAVEANAKISIEARAAGPWWFVARIYR